MTARTYIVRNDTDAEALANSLLGAKIDKPLRVTIEVYKKKRSVEQNRLQRLWMKEAADQIKDASAEDYRAYCKLHFGVSILCAENERFREAYERVFGSLTYEQKLQAMRIPLDFPVTRLMSVSQKNQYLNDVHDHLSMIGVLLTEPTGVT